MGKTMVMRRRVSGHDGQRLGNISSYLDWTAYYNPAPALAAYANGIPIYFSAVISSSGYATTCRISTGLPTPARRRTASAAIKPLTTALSTVTTSTGVLQ